MATLKAFWISIRGGFLGTLICLVLLALAYVTWQTLGRAYNGEVAFECLHTPACVQSLLQGGAAPASASPSGPGPHTQPPTTPAPLPPPTK